MTYPCPVCGYNLDEPAERHNICPSCGTQFDYDDDLTFFDGLTTKDQTHAALRRRWILNGAKWWDEEDLRPSNWSPIEQLANVPYQVTEDDRIAMAQSDKTTVGKLEFPDTLQVERVLSGFDNDQILIHPIGNFMIISQRAQLQAA